MKLILTDGSSACATAIGNGDLDRRTFLALPRPPRRRPASAPAGAARRLPPSTEVRFDGWGGVVQEAIHKYAFRPSPRRPASRSSQGTFGDETRSSPR